MHSELLAVNYLNSYLQKRTRRWLSAIESVGQELRELARIFMGAKN